jgi:hypothetical protein
MILAFRRSHRPAADWMPLTSFPRPPKTILLWVRSQAHADGARLWMPRLRPVCTKRWLVGLLAMEFEVP